MSEKAIFEATVSLLDDGEWQIFYPDWRPSFFRVEEEPRWDSIFPFVVK